MVEQLLLLKKFDVTCCLTFKDAEREMEPGRFSAAILDYFMPDITGLEVMKQFQSVDLNLPVIILTASRDIKVAVEAIRKGAFNYLVKPVDPDELYINLANALKNHSLHVENKDLKNSLINKYKVRDIIGSSKKMQEVFDLILRSSKVRSNVLITGETGVGKELVAKAIHNNSDRAEGPFIKVNCSALTESLLEAELFGIEKNVATGVDARAGKFERADGGTLFLDEVGDMAIDTQAKVLRAMQEREIERVGSVITRKIDIRILAATNIDLGVAIKEKKFRQDLFFRINVIVIPITSLRERQADIPDLVEHFLKKISDENRIKPKTLSKETMECFMSYVWPGNARELQNAIERSIVMCDEDVIQPSHLPSYMNGQLNEEHGDITSHSTISSNGESLEDQVAEFEKGLITSALEKHGWRQNRAADSLSISERSIWYKIKKLGIDLPNRKGG
tara:strand:- start:184171 stop:185520 length:1350 start_codon:yes stop_codon:yes gene_type:complete